MRLAKDFKVGDIYDDNGTMVICTQIINDRVYFADVEFDENDEPQPMAGTENWLTSNELNNLK